MSSITASPSQFVERVPAVPPSSERVGTGDRLATARLHIADPKSYDSYGGQPVVEVPLHAVTHDLQRGLEVPEIVEQSATGSRLAVELVDKTLHEAVELARAGFAGKYEHMQGVTGVVQARNGHHYLVPLAFPQRNDPPPHQWNYQKLHVDTPFGDSWYTKVAVRRDHESLKAIVTPKSTFWFEQAAEGAPVPQEFVDSTTTEVPA